MQRRRLLLLFLTIILSCTIGFSQENEIDTEQMAQLISDYEFAIAMGKVKIEELRDELKNIEKHAASKRAQENVTSISKLIVEYVPGNGGFPRIYNSLFFRPTVDSSTRVNADFLLQNGFGGSDQDLLRVEHADIGLNTSFAINNQRVNLWLGSFWRSATPFTIYRPSRKDDTWKKISHTFDGIFLETRFLGLNYSGITARTAVGGTSGLDRWLSYNSFGFPLNEGRAAVMFMGVMDDKLQSAGKIPYSSLTVGLDFAKKKIIGSKTLQLGGEANFNLTDNNVSDQILPTQNYAVRFEAGLDLKYPVFLNYYAISPQYPTGWSAIRKVDDSFIYQYEENYWEIDYLANLRKLELNVDKIQLGKAITVSFAGDWSREVESKLPTPKTFTRLGADVSLDLAKLNLVKAGSFNLKLESYSSRQNPSLDLKQDIAAVSLTGLNLKNLRLAMGYGVGRMEGLFEGGAFCQLFKAPYLEATVPLLIGTLTWKVQPKATIVNGNWEQELSNKLRLSGSVGPATYYRLEYETKGAELQRLNLELGSGF